MSGKRVTPAEVIRFNQLYAELGTYAAVAAATNRSASTVRRYVNPATYSAYVRAAHNTMIKEGN